MELNTTNEPILSEFSNLTKTSLAENVVYVLDLYAPPILICVGSICNVLVIIVMRMKYFRQVSTSFYICVNAFIDNISLFIPFPAHWLYVNFPDVFRQTENVADFLCKIFHFLGWFTSNLGIALTVAMTMERAVAIKFPLRALHLCTVKRAKYVSFGLAGFLALKEIHYLIQSVLVPPDVTAYMCEIKLDADWLTVYVQKVWPLIQNVFLLISFVTLIGNNIIIIRSVNSSLPISQASIQKAPLQIGQQRRSARTKQLTVMLLSDSLSIIICTLPLALFDVIRPKFEDPYVGHLVYAVAIYLVYINRCINFFLYCVSGERFRQALKSLFYRCRGSRSHRHSLAIISVKQDAPEDKTTSTAVSSKD